MKFHYILDVLRRRWWVLMGGVILAAGLYVFANRGVSVITYEAKAGLFILPAAFQIELEPQFKSVGQAQPSDATSKLDRRNALLALLASPTIAEQVFSDLQGKLPLEITTPPQLLGMVTGDVAGEVFQVKVTASEPELSANIANAWARAFERLANTTFGQPATPSNLDTDIAAAHDAYAEAQNRYLAAVKDSNLIELQDRFAERQALVTGLRQARALASQAAFTRRTDLDQLFVDAQTLRARVAAMPAFDMASYLAYLMISNRLLLPGDEGPTTTNNPTSPTRYTTQLSLNPDLVTKLYQGLTKEQFLADLDGLIAALDAKRHDLNALLGTTEVAGIATDGSATADNDLLARLEVELRDLNTSTSAEQERLSLLRVDRDAALETLKVVQNKAREASLVSSSGQARIVSFAIPALVPALQPVASSQITAAGLVLAGLMGFLVALGITAALEFVDTRVRRGSQLAKVPQLQLLAELPVAATHAGNHPVAMVQATAPFAEAMRHLRTALRTSDASSLVVTSATVGEGKTSTAANLAVVMANAGKQVILVDANLRAAALHRWFDAPNTAGLTTLLENGDTNLTSILQATPVPRLRLLTAGPASDHAPELLDSARMQELLAQLAANADLVVLDAPALTGVSDALALARRADLVLLVVRSGGLSSNQIRSVYQTLEAEGGHVVGAVLNAVPGATGFSAKSPEPPTEVEERVDVAKQQPPPPAAVAR